MRELKFRAFDKVSKSMSPAFSLFGEFTLIGTVFAWLDHVRGAPDGSSGLLSLNEIEVSQYTGLKDKNGDEIFEGDIVAIMRADYDNDEAMEAYYSTEGADQPLKQDGVDVVTMERFPTYWLEKERFGYEGEDLERPDDCVVIGNKYQNPELLENKNG